MTQTLPVLLVGFYIGFRYTTWFGDDAAQGIQNTLVALEDWVAALLSASIDWISTKLGGS